MRPGNDPFLTRRCALQGKKPRLPLRGQSIRKETVRMSSDSDLIGIPVALGAIVAILAVFAAFFLIGPVTGIVVLLAVVVLAGVLLVPLIRANEL
jgi:hypothetical protein